jgi:hypothetical protein
VADAVAEAAVVAGAAEPVVVAGLVAVPEEHAARADKAATDMPPSSARRESEGAAVAEVVVNML